MEHMLHGCAVVGQSGGPTAAINATLAGVIRGAYNAEAIDTLFGMRNGMEGLLKENLIDLTARFTTTDGLLDTESLDDLIHTPAAALGSCRKKLPDPHIDTDFYEALISIFRKRNIRYFFYIGGNDSMDTVAKLTEYLINSDYEMRVIGIPKTIDNDLVGTDHTPGFGSAAKYIATTLQEIVRDCAVYTVPAVTIVEIMGRDAGWLTASAALPACLGGYGPDYVYLPEVPFSMNGFFQDLRRAMEKKPNIVVAVSEGIRFSDGKYVGEGTQSGSADVFGHKYLGGTGKALELAVKKELGCKVRSVELNLPQRCAAHCASHCDLTESTEAGQAGVEAAVIGATGAMVSILRAPENGKNDSYSVAYETSEISGSANKVRSVPREFINDEGNMVTDECLAYIRPLIQGEPQIRFRNGIPVHIVL